MDFAETSRLVKRAVVLSWITVAYNLLEGVVSILFGVADESVALAGFGSDSFIEVASALMVLWRFRSETGSDEVLSLSRERSATMSIGVLFVALSLLVFAGASYQLLTASHPSTTLPGLVISSLSIGFMFFLYYAKMKVATALNSATVRKDAACSMACIKLSFVLFAGSIVFLLAPALWWADAVASLGLTYLIGREGFETVRAARDPRFAGGCGCVEG